MSNERTQIDYINLLSGLVEKHKPDIFKDVFTNVTIEKLSLSPKLYNHELSYGRLLKILYRLEDELKEKWIFLKVRYKYKQVPDKYMEIYHHIPAAEQFLPKFYFFSKIEETDESVIGIEFFRGTSLRNLLLTKMLFRKAADLNIYFNENGKKMRMFHDSQHSSSKKTIGEFIENTRQKLYTSHHFNNGEREQINRQISCIEKKVDATLALPLMHIHHDWSLRNIIVDEKQKIKIIDLDAYNRSIDWRWNDFAHFLINLESHIKYWPFITLKNIKELWKQFYDGYFNMGEINSVNHELLENVIYLIKINVWTDEYSLEEFYNVGIGRRFVKSFRKSLFEGRYTILNRERKNH